MRVARKVNFDYERRQKEMRKQKKRQEKLEAKRLRQEARKAGEEPPLEMTEASEFDEPGEAPAPPSNPS